MVAGVLALQGCVSHHIEHLTSLGVITRKVRLPEDLQGIDRIVLPGGESSTMLSLLKRSGLFEALIEFGSKRPMWGVCAGAILMAEEVVHPAQDSLGLIPLRAHRNFYGSQLESFKARLEISCLGCPLEVDFIRAPRLEPLQASVETLAFHDGIPVLLRSGNKLVSSFHTELANNPALHRLFLSL